MRLPNWILNKLQAAALHVVSREPDFVIGAADPKGPYMLRWYVIPRNRWFNIYVHHFLRSDEDEALHDHPWSNMSILLKGCYLEHTIENGGVHRKQLYTAGDLKLRLSGKYAHRVELTERIVLEPHKEPSLKGGGIVRREPNTCLTLFFTGPMYREWGFHCTKGWRKFSDFAALKVGTSDRGKGCG